MGGSLAADLNPLKAPPGADCFRIASFAYPRPDQEAPRAVLGMLDVDGREVMRRRFNDSTLTVAVPWPLFERMEREAPDSVLELPAWKDLRS